MKEEWDVGSKWRIREATEFSCSKARWSCPNGPPHLFSNGSWIMEETSLASSFQLRRLNLSLSAGNPRRGSLLLLLLEAKILGDSPVLINPFVKVTIISQQPPVLHLCSAYMHIWFLPDVPLCLMNNSLWLYLKNLRSLVNCLMQLNSSTCPKWNSALQANLYAEFLSQWTKSTWFPCELDSVSQMRWRRAAEIFIHNSN